MKRSSDEVQFQLHAKQNEQSHRHSLCSVMSHVVLFAYPIKMNISARKRAAKFLP